MLDYKPIHLHLFTFISMDLRACKLQYYNKANTKSFSFLPLASNPRPSLGFMSLSYPMQMVNFNRQTDSASWLADALCFTTQNVDRVNTLLWWCRSCSGNILVFHFCDGGFKMVHKRRVWTDEDALLCPISSTTLCNRTVYKLVR